MTKSNKMSNLLPIGTRVTHFDGNPNSTHGLGTIVRYNPNKPLTYFEEKPVEATDLGTKVPGGHEAICSGLYSFERYPYVVQFDSGYEDLYETTSVTPVTTKETK